MCDLQAVDWMVSGLCDAGCFAGKLWSQHQQISTYLFKIFIKIRTKIQFHESVFVSDVISLQFYVLLLYFFIHHLGLLCILMCLGFRQLFINYNIIHPV